MYELHVRYTDFAFNVQTEWSPSWDESHYASSLAPYLEAEGLPSNFIIDQGRVALPGARAEWGEWCNVEPAGLGLLPGAKQNNTQAWW
jgi:cellulose 1,4-beta-cellobiosidase